MHTLELEISLFLLRRLLGVKTEDKKQTKVAKLAKNELLLINIGSTSTGGRVLSVKADLAKIQLTSPACTEVGEKVALSRRIEKHWRLVGGFCGLLQTRPARQRRLTRAYRMGKRTAWNGARGRLVDSSCRTLCMLCMIRDCLVRTHCQCTRRALSCSMQSLYHSLVDQRCPRWILRTSRSLSLDTAASAFNAYGPVAPTLCCESTLINHQTC